MEVVGSNPTAPTTFPALCDSLSGGLHLGGSSPLGAFSFFLFRLNFKVFVFDVQTKAVVDAHVLVCDPYQGEERNEVSAPALVEELKAGDEEKTGGHIVAQAVLAGKYVKEFAAGKSARLAMLALAVFAGFAENLFMGGRPGDAGHGNGEDHQFRQLYSESDWKEVCHRDLDADGGGIVGEKTARWSSGDFRDQV